MKEKLAEIKKSVEEKSFGEDGEKNKLIMMETEQVEWMIQKIEELSSINK